MRPDPRPPVELTTTRAANGAMTTSTPDMRPRGGGGGLDGMLGQILARRRAAPRAAAPAAPRGTGAVAEQVALPRAPQMGRGEAKPLPVTRTRRVANAPSIGVNWADSSPAYRMESEYQLPDGSWSLDAMYGTNVSPSRYLEAKPRS